MAAEGWIAAGKAAAEIGGQFIGIHAQKSAAADDRQFQERENERARAHSEALQREFAQHGIQWRVDDARAAGLHPVFALGGGGAAYSAPSVSVSGGRQDFGASYAEMGQSLGRAIAAQETPEQRETRLMALRVQSSTAERNEAEAGYYRAQEGKILSAGPGMPSTLLGESGQNVNMGGNAPQGGVVIPDWDQHVAGNLGAITLKPNEVVSSVANRPFLAPGLKPMWEKGDFGIPGLRSKYIPRTDDFWETWGELSWYDKIALMAASGYLGRKEDREKRRWERDAAADPAARFGGSRQRGGNLHWGKIRR